MPGIEFSKEEKQAITEKIQRYFEEELDQNNILPVARSGDVEAWDAGATADAQQHEK